MSSNDPEPDPVQNNNKFVWEEVMKDMKKRDEIGAIKYNTRLQPHNGRNPLIDAYQEALDMVVYLKQAIMEEEMKKMFCNFGALCNSKSPCKDHTNSYDFE